MFEGANVGFSRTHLSLRLRRLTPRARSIQFCQQLALLNVRSFFHQKLFHGCPCRRVGFEILNWFDFAVGRNYASNGAASDCGR